jgi:hypothetical protein
MPVLEAGDLGVAGFAEVAQQRPGGLAGPAVLCLFGQVLGGLDQVEGLINELLVLPEADVLVVGETDVGVGVIADVDGPSMRSVGLGAAG